MTLEGFKEAIAAFVLVVLVIAALALALNSFSDDMGDQCAPGHTFNKTDGQCYDNAGILNASQFTTQYNVTVEGLEGVSNASGYLSTVGTLIGVGALIAVVISAFYIIRR